MLASGSAVGAVARAWLSHASAHAAYRVSNRVATQTAERWVAIRSASGQVSQATAAAYRTTVVPAQARRRARDRAMVHRERRTSAGARSARRATRGPLLGGGAVHAGTWPAEHRGELLGAPCFQRDHTDPVERARRHASHSG